SCAGCRTSCRTTWPRARRRSSALLRPLIERAWLGALLLPAMLAGQGRGVELHLGRWYNGNRADVYEFRTSSPLGGPFTHGFGASVLVNGSPTGVSAVFGVSVGGGRREGGRGRGGYGGPPELPPPAPPTTISGNAGDVVQTAIESLGTPYIWGGTADNGFDCSGLIQYAYGQHGIRLPRMSRDQARAGAEVAPVVDALRPGDVLLFSTRPGAGVTHVGM